MKPASLHLGQLTASSLAEVPPVLVPIGIEMVRITSPMRFIAAFPAAVAAATVGRPLLQDALHVPPTAAVVGHRLGHRLLDPGDGVGLQGVDEVVSDERGEEA